MKAFLYILAILQTATICFLTSQMAERPFATKDMGKAYYFGCTLAFFKTEKSTASFNYCSEMGTYYAQKLEELIR